MFKVYGIRHHGPGSARSLQKALAHHPPDCILIEAPQDTEGVLPYFNHPELKPPVAVLVYNTKDPGQAAYLPFARFSPEWQAAVFGLERQIPVHFMDLPMAMQFAEEGEESRQLSLGLPGPPEEAPEIKDPMGYMAQLAGYEDSERWWEATFEQPEHEADVFAAILQMNTAFRDELQRRENPHNLLREAFMRKVLRKAIKDGYKNIAVVCGAWHSPALHYLDRFKAKDDNALLKGRKKVKTQATWIPWTAERLAFQSGYRAGVVSPAYYNLLFHQREALVQHWMAKAAGLLRAEGFDASAAQAVDATRLAYALSSLSQQPLPGIAEMEAAALSVFGHGQVEVLHLIRQKLVIGEEVGDVPDAIPQIPLQKDLERRVKAARLARFYKAGEAGHKTLDLRKPTNLEASYLLHQLRALNIPWGSLLEEEANRLGSFSESWQLEWQPEYIIRLIQAGMWGNTVVGAVGQYLLKQASESRELNELVRLAQTALLCGTISTFPGLVRRIAEASALSKDTEALMRALPVLTDIQRYGDARQTDTSAVAQLVNELVPRICIGLPGALLHIEEEAARQWHQLILLNNNAISLLDQEALTEHWSEALQQVADAEPAHPLLQGLCTRIRYDKGGIGPGGAATRMRYALSYAPLAEDAALWLEGFLYGSALLLLHLPELWDILDEWVAGQESHHFEATLPLLRRAFANFSPPEREKLLALARTSQKAEGGASAQQEPAIDQQRAKAVFPTLKLLLGLQD